MDNFSTTELEFENGFCECPEYVENVIRVGRREWLL